MSDTPKPVTKALVLAAGLGSRLGGEVPKPLFRVLGLPLLARTLYTLQRGGVTDAYVVIGHEAERIRAEMERWQRPGLRVHWVFNPDWKEPNGISVLAAESELDEPFFLTMTDHLFRPEAVRALAERGAPEGIDLVVDYDVDSVLDLEDATKVMVRDGRIVRIGKELDDFDAIDTGVFLATPALFGAIREASADGQSSLSAGVQRLALTGKARVTDVGEYLWQDVDTPEDLAAAERKLLAALTKPSDGWVSRHLNRPVSKRISRLLVDTPVTPNQISVAAMLITFVGAAFAVLGGYLNFLLAGALFHFASIVDGTDGEVAKLKFLESRRGEWIDTVCDNVSYLVFIFAVVVGVYRSDVPDFYVYAGVVGLLAGAASIVNLTSYVARERASGSFLSVRYGYQDGTDWVSRVLQAVHFAGKRDFFAFFAFVLAIFGQLPLALPILGVGATLLLFPATLKANLSSYLRRRRQASDLSSSGA